MQTRLKEVIEERGIMQKFLVDKTGVTTNTMSGYVTGRQIPSVKNAYRIAKVLGVKVEDIWYDEEFDKELKQSKKF
ncbi:helix-turn-helix transcriptional regulator [Metabacillus arenae]|uniref:Helix-turn-helix transcriptional regulator n=1 Tax=Metabacillus arenae TaxID=2771434 RepID=A0A926RWK3_9BACI|nr:helix-turn-helix transcriptional regulator [Metabacillus arenae]MBD1379247.1 helix-turn-helix transcriptional regulator [Metabacillus arenae]